MSTHLHTFDPARADLTEPTSSRAGSDAGRTPDSRPPASRLWSSRLWAAAGIGAGVLGIGTVITSSSISAVYDEKLGGDAVGIADKLGDLTPNMFAFHSITALGAVLTIVFAAGLAARLRAVAPSSIAPLVAFAGLVGTAVVSVLGSGLDTEFMITLTSQPDAIVPEAAVMYNHWVGTIPWLFTLSGLAGLATYAVSRTGGVPHWIGRTGLVLGGLTILAGVSPFEYMAAVPGTLWTLVAAIGFCVGDKRFRSA